MPPLTSIEKSRVADLWPISALCHGVFIQYGRWCLRRISQRESTSMRCTAHNMQSGVTERLRDLLATPWCPLLYSPL